MLFHQEEILTDYDNLCHVHAYMFSQLYISHDKVGEIKWNLLAVWTFLYSAFLQLSNIEFMSLKGSKFEKISALEMDR